MSSRQKLRREPFPKFLDGERSSGERIASQPRVFVDAALHGIHEVRGSIPLSPPPKRLQSQPLLLSAPRKRRGQLGRNFRRVRRFVLRPPDVMALQRTYVPVEVDDASATTIAWIKSPRLLGSVIEEEEPASIGEQSGAVGNLGEIHLREKRQRRRLLPLRDSHPPRSNQVLSGEAIPPRPLDRRREIGRPPSREAPIGSSASFTRSGRSCVATRSAFAIPVRGNCRPCVAMTCSPCRRVNAGSTRMRRDHSGGNAVRSAVTIGC